jgi:hypothetical protein
MRSTVARGVGTDENFFSSPREVLGVLPRVWEEIVRTRAWIIGSARE